MTRQDQIEFVARRLARADGWQDSGEETMPPYVLERGPRGIEKAPSQFWPAWYYYTDQATWMLDQGWIVAFDESEVA